MASLCSVTSSKKILQSYRRRRHDDRPFARSQKVILPIRGFKGNRVLYGDSLDAACELTEYEEDEEDEEDEETGGEGGEPVYSEPQFEVYEESQLSSSDITVSSGYFSHQTASPANHITKQSLSSPESGYLSSDEDCLVFQTGSPRPPYKILYHPPGPTRPAPPPYRPPPPPSSRQSLLTEDLLVRTLEEQWRRSGVEGMVWTRCGQQRVLLLGRGQNEVRWPGDQLEVNTNQLEVITSQVSCLHRLVARMEDDWTASYLESAGLALMSISPWVQWKVELSAGPLTLHCLLPESCQDVVTSHSHWAGLEDLREAINTSESLSQIVTALRLINIPAEDILRVVTASGLLSSIPEDSNQRQSVMVAVAELLGLALSPDHLTNILYDNQNLSGQPSVTVLLARYLTLKTIHSIVKKVNRTIKRRYALKILCQSKPRSNEISLTTIKIANSSFAAVEGESSLSDLSSPWLPESVTQMFLDNSLCNFGFASHLFQPESDSLISEESRTAPGSTAMRVFCLDPERSLVSQVRETCLLEAVLGGLTDGLWQCYTTAQFSTQFRCLASRDCQDEAETVFSVLDLVADCDSVELCQESGTILLGIPAQQRLEEARDERREESARIIQDWWRLRRFPPHLPACLAESDLIETVLMKYETLQRQSESLVYSFTDRTRSGSECQSYDSLENLMAVPAAVLETENSYQNVPEILTINQTEQEEEEEDCINEEIVLKTSQLYGIDLVRFIITPAVTNSIII